MKKLMSAIGLISAIASTLGILFKFLHLQGDMFLTTYGILVFSSVYVPWRVAVWYKENPDRNFSEKLRIFFALLSGLITGAAILTSLAHGNPVLIKSMFVIGAVLFSFGFLPILFFNLYRKSIA